jgi:hypothetical protein
MIRDLSTVLNTAAKGRSRNGRTYHSSWNLYDLQGAEKALHRKIVHDPTYLVLVSQLIDDKDFVFEEASGMGPTKAERLALSQLGPGHHLDVDPHPDKKLELGIGETGTCREIEPSSPDPLVNEFHREQAKREELWIKTIAERKWHNALFICGYLHALSMAFRLDRAGYEVETCVYIPYGKLCRRQHVAGRVELPSSGYEPQFTKIRQDRRANLSGNISQ